MAILLPDDTSKTIAAKHREIISVNRAANVRPFRVRGRRNVPRRHRAIDTARRPSRARGWPHRLAVSVSRPFSHGSARAPFPLQRRTNGLGRAVSTRRAPARVRCAPAQPRVRASATLAAA